MAKGKALSEYEKGQIDTFKSQGRSNRKIAEEIGRSLNVVNRYVRDPKNYGITKSPGAPPKLNERDKRRIIRAAVDGKKSCRKIQREVVPEVSKSTVWNVLNEAPDVSHEKMVAAPKLKDHHKVARLAFAREHMTWKHDWNRVFFCVLENIKASSRLFGRTRKSGI